MTDQILARHRVPALSDSTALAVDCGKYLQMMLLATDMGQHSAVLSTAQVAETTGIDPFRQAQVRTALRIAGLIHIDWSAGGYGLGLGDGQ